MRTHELAVFLKELSVVLDGLPDVELASLPEVLINLAAKQGTLIPIQEPKRTPRRIASIDDVNEALAALDKRELVELLHKANLSVEIRSKDSARDAIRKINRHLAEHPASVKDVKGILKKERPALTSEPLSKALDTLLGD